MVFSYSQVLFYLSLTNHVKGTVNSVGSDVLSSAALLTSDRTYTLGVVALGKGSSIFVRPILDTDSVIFSGAEQGESNTYSIDTYMSRSWVGNITIDQTLQDAKS